MKPFVSLKVAAEDKTIPGVSKETSFRVDPKLITVETGFNRPICRENVDQFKSSIKAGATIPPIFVRVDLGVIILVDGEHRVIAVRELIEEGETIESMAAIHFRGNDADRVAHILTSAQGKPLTPLDAGLQYLKLERYGWDRKKIAERIGRTISHVDSCILLAESNTDVQSAVKRGEISSTGAIDAVRTHGEAAGKVIAEKLVEAKAKGKKKVTAAITKPKSEEPKQTTEYERGYNDGWNACMNEKS